MLKSDWISKVYFGVKYELLPIKSTYFTIRREIQNVKFFQATPIFAWRQNFHYKILFHSYSNLQIYPQSWMMRKVGTYFSHDFECMKLVYVYSIEKYNDFVFKLVLNQLFWFLAASLAASLAALAALWAITRSLRISTSASPWRNISLILLVSCWAASVRLTTSA